MHFHLDEAGRLSIVTFVDFEVGVQGRVESRLVISSPVTPARLAHVLAAFQGTRALFTVGASIERIAIQKSKSKLDRTWDRSRETVLSQVNVTRITYSNPLDIILAFPDEVVSGVAAGAAGLYTVADLYRRYLYLRAEQASTNLRITLMASITASLRSSKKGRKEMSTKVIRDIYAALDVLERIEGMTINGVDVREMDDES